MKRLLLIGLFVFGLSSTVFAQATPTSRLGWDQTGPDLATVQAYTYRYYPDGSSTGVTLGGVTCTGATSPFACIVAFPAFTPGPHSLQLSASNVAGESLLSAPLNFVMVLVPAAPINLRIQ